MTLMLSKDCLISRSANAQAAGSTAYNGAVFDMDGAGFNAVMGIAALGTLTASQVTTLKCQQGAAANLSDAADITGAITTAMADGDSNKLLVLDVAKSLFTKRYGRFVVNRATANAVIDSVVAIQYNACAVPVTPDATVSQTKQAY